MPTKIAVICSEQFQHVLEKIVIDEPQFQLDYYTYEFPEQAPTLLKEVKPCDILLLSGTLPYLYAKPELDQWPTPWTYLKQDESSISTTLLSLLVDQPVKLNRLSIDVMNLLFIDNVLNDLHTTQRPYIQTIALHTPYDDYVNHHKNLWDNGEVDFIITSIHAVYNQLKALNIPVMRMMDPKSSILRYLYEAKAISERSKSDLAKAAVGHLAFTESPPKALIETIATTLSGFYRQLDPLQIEFYTTNGNLQQGLATLQEDLNSAAMKFKFGFGYGHSILQAREHAKHALSFAEQDTIYLLDDHKQLHGPIGEHQQSIALQATDPVILKITRDTHLSPKNISRLIEFNKAHPSISFTAQDLADYLQVTRRTTERILKKLVDHSYVMIVGEEMTYQQGRPRALYELNFSSYV